MSTFVVGARPLAAARDFTREAAFGLPIWAAFLLALEPDNVARALNAGVSVDWVEETVRIVTASLLGASSTPLVLAMVRRFPVDRRQLWRNLAVQAGGSGLIAFGLIFVSCILAATFKIGDPRPVFVALPHQLNANWLLLIFCLATLIAVAHAAGFAHTRPPVPEAVQQDAAFIANVAVKSRGRMTIVELSEVDWIESQGNYLALHAGGAVHLLRESLQGLEAKLDPERFLRIHRRILVARDRICGISALPSGDASVCLKDGTALRVSRNFRERLRRAFEREN